MAERYCKVCDGWHDLDRPWPHNCLPERPKRAYHLPLPSVISDQMDPVQSMADGLMYDSKSAIRAGYKAGGFIEVGDDPARLNPKPRVGPDEKQIDAAVEQAFARLDSGDYKTA